MKQIVKQTGLGAGGLMLVLLLTLAAFQLPLGTSLSYLWEGAFGDKFGVSRTLVKFIPLLLTGLGVVVAWRTRMFNVGGEGQFLVGALGSAWLAKQLVGQVQPQIGVPLLLAASAAGGAGWALIAGFLSIKRGVDLVISTILLNFIAIELLSWSVTGPLQEAKRQVPLTQALPKDWMLGKFDRQTDLHTGLILALVVASAVYVFLMLTKVGFQMRVVGENAEVARANRYPVTRLKVLAMSLSGGLCGLAGGVEYLGMTGQLSAKFSQNWGFLAIPVALLAGLHPLVVILSAFTFGALFAGSENLARFTPAGSTLVYVIQAVSVLAYVGLRAWQSRKPKVVVEEDQA